MKCVRCSENLSEFRNVNSKYCPVCRDVVHKEHQAKARAKVKLKRANDPIFHAKSQFKAYRDRSPDRGLGFELTEDDFIKMVDVPCYYCGQDYHGVGFDRVDNSVGYRMDNVVSCCPDCNKMKHIFDVHDFINRCKMISNKHK